MKYCSQCGAEVSQEVPEDDDRPRYVCGSCHTVHYQNPNMVVGCIPEMDDRILLCRRAIPPRRDYWTLPAGFLEFGETPADGARREALEETGARVEIGDLFTLITLIHVGQVYLVFRAKLLEKTYGPTKESLEVRLFAEEEIPWPRIAFSSIKTTLELYFQDRAGGRFRMHQRALTESRRE